MYVHNIYTYIYIYEDMSEDTSEFKHFLQLCFFLCLCIYTYTDMHMYVYKNMWQLIHKQ